MFQFLKIFTVILYTLTVGSVALAAFVTSHVLVRIVVMLRWFIHTCHRGYMALDLWSVR